MPLEFGIWRIDSGLERVEMCPLDEEQRLENVLDQDIGIVSPNWMVIGRQVPTIYGKFIDLLAIDADGSLVVLELKKDKTPREVVAQLLDYGHWIENLTDTEIAEIYEKFLAKYRAKFPAQSLDDAFKLRFGVKDMPEELNTSHQLVVVASALDDSTERIVSYLADKGISVNAVFFRCFKDGDREYLSRAWLIDPTRVEPTAPRQKNAGPWNKEFYVSFGEGADRKWEDAVKYGFIAGGGGRWYSKTLELLSEKDRVWVNVPGFGYVGVGIVTGPAVKVDEFKVKGKDGVEHSITELPVAAPSMFKNKDNEETAEYLVPVKWVKTVPLDGAVKEKGFFGNQNTVCKPTAASWVHTVERLRKRLLGEGGGAVLKPTNPAAHV